MKKRILSLALALALCLGLTIPAMAAEPGWNLEVQGKSDEEIVMPPASYKLRNWVGNEETFIGLGEASDSQFDVNAKLEQEDTVLLSAENASNVTVQAWSDPEGDGIYDQRLFRLIDEEEAVEVMPIATVGPLEKIVESSEKYEEYNTACVLNGSGQLVSPGPRPSLRVDNGSPWAEVSISVDDLLKQFGPNTILFVSFYDWEQGANVGWALHLPGNSLSNVPSTQPSQPTAPAEPSQPVTPDAPGTYTVKKWDTWSTICTNFYGNNAQRYALMKANKSVKLTEGTIITLPEKLGKDTLIPAPVCAEGEKLYTVKAGDTLGKIALAEYGSMTQYKAIFERNSDRLANPNMIYEGQIIVLPVISK